MVSVPVLGTSTRIRMRLGVAGFIAVCGQGNVSGVIPSRGSGTVNEAHDGVAAIRDF